MSVQNTSSRQLRSSGPTDSEASKSGTLARGRNFPIGVKVLGVDVAAFTKVEALKEIGALLDANGSARVVFVNAACLNLSVVNKAYRQVLAESDLVLNDGVGLDIAARLQGQSFPSNLNGTDLTPEVLRLAASRSRSVFLLGGTPGVADIAKERLERTIDGLRVVGTSHGFQTTTRENDELVEIIRRSGADVLVVGMGAPVQELWLDQYLSQTGARLGVAVGAFIDFAAGRVPRAPHWLQRRRLEWLFRLSLEPKRLFARYVVGNPVFLVRVVRDRNRLRAVPNTPRQRKPAEPETDEIYVTLPLP